MGRDVLPIVQGVFGHPGLRPTLARNEGSRCTELNDASYCSRGAWPRFISAVQGVSRWPVLGHDKLDGPRRSSLTGAVPSRNIQRYTVGNTKRVNAVDVTSPPITTVAKGRCTSAPAPEDNAIGTKPRLATSAVMSTGRRRVCRTCTVSAWIAKSRR